MVEENLLKETKKKSKKKFWMVIFIIGMLSISSVIYIIIEKPFNNEITPVNNISFNQFVCSQIPYAE